jgi:phage/plasmid primase-like uncharacterized protein
MGQALPVTVELTEINCGECGGVYALNERYRQTKADKGGFWHCPYCQVSWGYGKGELQRQREALEAEKQRHQATLARLNDTVAERDRIARAAERAAKRTAAGVCTCCNRTFQNLARHMATKHKGT